MIRPEHGLVRVVVSVASPKVLEAVRRHFGVPDRVLDVPMAEVVPGGVDP